MTSKLKKRAAAIGVAAVVGVGGGLAGVAYAYPSGFPLTVSAQATQATNGQSTVTVTLGNNDPRCSHSVTIDGETELVAAGTTTYTRTIQAGSGRHRVRVRTVDCAGLKERARAEFVVPNASISGQQQGQVKEQIRYQLAGLEPGTTVTVTATRVGGSETYSDTDTVDRRGEAKVRLKFRVAGTYAVSATVNGAVVASTSITING